MNKIKVAVIGCGPVANCHLSGWKKIKNSQIVVAVDINESVGKATAKTWKIPAYYPSISQALEREQVDVVDICTPPQVHASLAIEAMEKGAAVLIEKPMTMTLKDSDAILSCAKKTGSTVGVIHNWLFERCVLEAKKAIEHGRLGEVMNVAIEALALPSDSMAANEKHWCHRLPGGRFGEMLVHPIYLARYFLGGDVLPVDVQVSKLGTTPWMKSDELYATFSCGEKLGHVYASFNSPREAIFLSIYGRNGILKVDIINSVTIFLPGQTSGRFFSRGYDYLRQAKQLTNSTIRNSLALASGKWLTGHQKYISLFAECLRNGNKPPVTAQEARETIAVLEQMCKRVKDIQEKT